MTAYVTSRLNGETAEVEASEGINLTEPGVVTLGFGPELVSRFSRNGNDLRLELSDGRKITVRDFFVTEDGQRSEIIFTDEAGVTWWGQYSDPWTGFHIAEIETGLPPVAYGFAGLPLGLLGAVAGGAALIGGGGGKAAPAKTLTVDLEVNQETALAAVTGHVAGGREGEKVVLVLTDSAGNLLVRIETSLDADGRYSIENIDISGASPGDITVVASTDGAVDATDSEAYTPPETPADPGITITDVTGGDDPELDVTVTGTSDGEFVTVSWPGPGGEIQTSDPIAVGEDGRWSYDIPRAEIGEGEVTLTATVTDGEGTPVEAAAGGPITDDADAEIAAQPETPAEDTPPVLSITVNGEGEELSENGNLDGNASNGWGGQWQHNASPWHVGGAFNTSPLNDGMIGVDMDGLQGYETSDGEPLSVWQTVEGVSAGDKVQLEYAWNNGWGGNGAGSPMSTIISYNGVELLRITTADSVAGADNDPNADLFAQGAGYAVIEVLHEGLQFTVNGEVTAQIATWAATLQATNNRSSASYFDENNLFNLVEIVIPAEVLASGDGSNDLKVSYGAPGTSGVTDDVQIGGLKIVKTSDELEALPANKPKKLISDVEITIADGGALIDEASVSILGFGSGDSMVFAETSGFTVTDNGGGAFTISGVGQDVAAWNAFLATAIFTSGDGGDRTVVMTVTDANGLSSNEASFDIGSGISAEPLFMAVSGEDFDLSDLGDEVNEDDEDGLSEDDLFARQADSIADLLPEEAQVSVPDGDISGAGAADAARIPQELEDQGLEYLA